jgi:sec-independent protein translocase protein TatB
MFDIGWSELLIVGIVALVVVGPKDLPVLLRTIGKYVGMIRRQAGEFRAQFDEAMRDAELEKLKQEVTALKADAEQSLRETEHSVSSEFGSAKAELDRVTAEPTPVALPPTVGAAAAAAAAAADPPEPAHVIGAAASHMNGSAGATDHAAKPGA